MSQQNRSTFVLTDPSEILQALVGLKDVRVLHYERRGPDVELVIEQVVTDQRCPSCRGPALVKERPFVSYVDLPVYGQPMRLGWRKHRMCCVDSSCPRKSWVLTDHRIAAKHCLLTTRAAKWATVQVGTGRTVKEVAGELACDWHTVNDAVTTYGTALLDADRKRLNKTIAIGLDETSFVRTRGHSHAEYATTVCDVEHHQIIDILPSRNYVEVASFLDKQPKSWKERIRFGALDMSATYAAVYSVVLAQGRPGRRPVPSRLPCQSLPRSGAPDGCRTNRPVIAAGATTRSIGREGHCFAARSHLDRTAAERLASLLELGDPNAEVAIAYRVKERLRDFYRSGDREEARQMLDELAAHCTKRAMPPEVQKLGRTLRQWFEKICNYHLARMSNGPTEALNNLIKRIKRIGFGFRNFENYRIRALLYAGKPNWRVLGSIVVR